MAKVAPVNTGADPVGEDQPGEYRGFRPTFTVALGGATDEPTGER